MTAYKRPIHKSLVVGSAVFIAFMCFLLSIQSYLTYSKSLYKRYDDKLENILEYINHQIDLDDLYQCVITGDASEKYAQFQHLLNYLIDDFKLFYLYSIAIRNDKVHNISSATNNEERARGEEDMVLLELVDEYEPSEIAKYANAIAKDEISYFEENSEFYGAAYTACKPLVTTTGVHFGALCADISIEDLHKTVNSYILYNVLLTLSLGILFGLVLFIWMRHNVTGPILALERSARKFAERSHTEKDPDELIFEAPEIHTRNEVESLSNAITQMSRDMKIYVQDILEAEKSVRSAQERAENMAILAFRDALTHVGSKVAYDNAATMLDKDISDNKVSSFAIAMIDLNDLKTINDTYGHANGNTYITGACHILCNIFTHSPVYRIGGDEFVVILKDVDFDKRKELIEKARETFAKTEMDATKEPWERYSIAIGISEFFKSGETVESVFKRADEEMYNNKLKMKKNRK